MILNCFYFDFQCILSLVMLTISDVHTLITYSMIVESFFIMLSVSAVLYFRYKRPNMHRPIKVSTKISLQTIHSFLAWNMKLTVIFRVISAPTHHPNLIFHIECCVNCRSSVWQTFWSFNGHFDYRLWYSSLLFRCIVEGQAEMHSKCYWYGKI